MNTGFLGPAVATVLTVYGIETYSLDMEYFLQVCCNSAYRLRYWNKLGLACAPHGLAVATVLTVYGIETYAIYPDMGAGFDGCNSAYRLRYWNRPTLIV